MDLTRLAVDAGQFINRAVQYTGETLGQADRTEVDSGLEELLVQADVTKTWTDQIISQTEVLLQPNLGARLEDRLYHHLDWSVPSRPRAHELLGDQMSQAGLEVGSDTPYGAALLRCGDAQKHLGEADKHFVQSAHIHFLAPLLTFTDGEYRTIQEERRMLFNKRLDLDISKSRLRKAQEADEQARNLNTNLLENDYYSHVSYMFSFLRVKWLKMWAQEIAQAEMELRICQSLFDRQLQITRRLLEGISKTHTDHMWCLTDFVDAQACYYAQCHQYAQALHKHLARIPAMLCANNWQSTIHHVANETTSPIPIVIHHVPDFDQDSWTRDPLCGTEQTGQPSGNIQQADWANNNNNNNTSLVDNHHATANILSPASQASSYAKLCMPIWGSHPLNQCSTSSWTVSRSMMNNRMVAAKSPGPSSILTFGDRLNQILATDAAGSLLKTNSPNQFQIETAFGTETPTTNHTGAETLTTDDMAAKTLITNEMAAETLITSGMIAEILTNNNMATETLTTNERVAENLATNEVAAETLITNERVAETLTTSDMAAETLTTSDMAAETLTTNEVALETLTTNEMVAETLATNKMAAETKSFC
ncbi:uncharacterized protein LOC117532008 [Thalassophryne amazonica]|uniref:uncharacterized protein LOC117532008 n=1 Tax=Thalassophryne amazonica TaxID=390379 RepID=UPI0014715816|nr:uncharacterized protein LOC117532008 [Thalassophryne amazonica]